MPHNILIIDDDTMVSTSLELLLKRAGYGVKSVSRPAEALPAIAEHRPSLALLDMNFTIDTSGKDGMGLLKRILGQYPGLPVIQMTGWATVQLAVEGMKAGARDFIAKPWDNRELLNAVAIQIDKFPVGHDFLGAPAGAENVKLQRGDLLRVLRESTFTDQSTFTVTGAVRDSSVTLPFPQDGALTLEAVAYTHFRAHAAGRKRV